MSSPEAVCKVIHSIHIPCAVLFEVLGTKRDQRELLSKAGIAAHDARTAGDDPVEAARAVIRSSDDGRRGRGGLSGRQLAREVNALDPAGARAFWQEFWQHASPSVRYEILRDLRDVQAETTACDVDADPDTTSATPVVGDRSASIEEDAAAGANNGASRTSPTVDSVARSDPADRRGGGTHATGGPRGGCIDDSRAAELRRRLQQAVDRYGGTKAVANETRIAVSTISSVLKRRTPSGKTAAAIERSLGEDG